MTTPIPAQSARGWLILAMTASIWLGLCWGSTTHAGNSPLDTLQPGEWYEVPNSHLRSVLPSPIPANFSGPDSIMKAWSGGVYDTRRDRLVVWGGGHADYSGNEVYAFDLGTLRWQRLTNPSPTTLPNPAGGGLLNVASGQTSLDFNGDNTPISVHTYDGLEYLPNVDRFFSQGGSRWSDGNGIGLTWMFNFDTLRWERKNDFTIDRNFKKTGNKMAYDPVTGHVFMAIEDEGLFEYDPLADRWTQRSQDFTGYSSVAEIDPIRRKFVMVGNGAVRMYNIGASGPLSIATLNTTGDTEIVKALYPGLAYDPVSGLIVAWTNGGWKPDPAGFAPWSGSGGDVYTLNLDTLVWTKRISISASVPPLVPEGQSNGTHGRWRYIPSKNVFIGVGHIDQNVWIYKLATNLNSVPVAPTITAQPTNQIVTVGQTATFSLVATGTASLSYQWQQKSVNLSGATGASYTTPVTVIGDNGATFRCVVTSGTLSTTSNSATLSVTTPTSPPITGLQASYSLNEGSGTVVTDSSGSNNNGTLVGNPTWGIGKVNGALQFNGTSAYVTVNQSPSLQFGLGSFTVEGWVNSATIFGHVITNLNNATFMATPGWRLVGGTAFQMRVSDGTRTVFSTPTSPAMTQGTWHHVAAVVDRTAQRLHMYLDGVETTPAVDISTVGSLTNANAAITLGSLGTGGQYFAGSLDEMNVYNNARSLAQIQQDMNAGVTPPTSDTTPPTVSMTAPSNNSPVSGASVMLTAMANDNAGGTGVKGVQFQLADNPSNPVNIGAEVTAVPYTATWDTTPLSNGSHALQARVRDNANPGNVATSPVITVTVNNPTPSGNQPPTANPQSVSVAFNTANVITLTGSDPEGSALTYSIVTTPTHGALSGAGANQTYTPNSGYSGADNCTFKVNDGSLNSAPATVSITVASAPSSGLAIPLTIQELLPADDAGGYPPRDMPGKNRTQEPATFGVPLKDSDGVADITQLAVLDTLANANIPAQFRVLKRYPSTHIQWVLIDVQVDVPANGQNTALTLVTGTSPVGMNLAQDTGSTITVATGPAQFTLRKANQNVLDSAVVDGVTLVAGGHSLGLSWQDAAGMVYRSVNDSGSTAVLEENGPLRAVVKETGRLKSAAGAARMGYELRMYFYKGHKWLRAEMTIENGYLDDLTRKAIGDVEWRLPLSVGGTTAEIATQAGTTMLNVTAGTTAYAFQGRNSHKRSSTAITMPGFNSIYDEENDFDPGGAFSFAGAGQDGCAIQNGTTIVQGFTGQNQFCRGFADLRDSSNRGLTVAVLDFDAFYPNSLELTSLNGSSAEMAYQLFSIHNTLASRVFDWGVHETRDAVLEFHTAASDPLLDHYRANYPLFGRTTIAQYATSGALLDNTQLVDLSDLQAFYAAHDWTTANLARYGLNAYQLPNEQDVRFRAWVWSSGGRENNNDISWAKILGYLQTGKGGLFRHAFNFVRFTADQGVHHSDASDRTAWPQVQLEDTVTPPIGSSQMFNGNGAGLLNKIEDNMEHQNVLGFPALYYLTGDEMLRDALIDHGEWFLKEHPYSAFQATCDMGKRGVAQRMKWLGVLSQLTGDARYQRQYTQPVVGLIENSYLCATIANPANFTDVGMDMDRGYVWEQDTNTPAQFGRWPVTGPVHSIRLDGLFEAVRVLPESDPRREELRDRLTGAASWDMLEAFQDENGGACRGYGTPQGKGGGSDEVNLDGQPITARTQNWNGFDHARLMKHAWERTGDVRFRTTERRAISVMGAFSQPTCVDNGTHVVTSQGYAVYDGLGANAFVWDELHPPAVTFLNDDTATYGGLTVKDNGGGSYTLSWTVPQGASTYQIKYGPQPMVPNLNFDRVTRRYQYDPAVYDNFWAGNGDQVTNQPCNVPGIGGSCTSIQTEPAPAAAGTLQTFTLSGLPANQHFALTSTTNASGGNPTALPGDVDGNGVVDILDLQRMVNVLLGVETDVQVIARADLNGDGSPTILDLQQLVNLLLGS